MRFAALAALALVSATPSLAAVAIQANHVDFANTPYVYQASPGNFLTFSYNPQEQFDPSPVSISTNGTFQVITVFGQPAVSFADPAPTFGPDSFPGFGSVPQTTVAPFTLTDSALGLRYGVGTDYYYGYTRFAGSQIETIAFETTPNTAILAAAAPEASTWAMMTIGFGAVGGALRRRRTMARRLRAA